ncbi:recombinase RecT [Rodentibacter pneumotropicus]|uniref:Recombinase RecT n=1 Tax=Rodentibacter pneumotropicus TaxID=758 RepID=A0A4S2Q7A4_9PAST|nr:recombinase RecT [Rodentibacter pneumotropicus]TGZ99485.1 hypothetical protein D3M79_06490 [Rodentibacter pneumotropicus]TGZ99985.1 hypothetical protein D3M74_08620 [Rodentibacter pneumotropicus]THA09083.1 hypothetical protein D3M77_03380 [Rodentibacter pneumotropicus]THA12610.1 hypothetical protein D3M76_09810 [Rodentibacter pneumotropicus]
MTDNKIDNKEKKLTPIEQRKVAIKHYIGNAGIQSRIKSLLSDPNKKEKFSATLINVALDDSLVYCSPESIVKSGLQAAELDLPLNKNMGLAYIVKYKKEAEFQIGYKGWLLLAKRAGINLRATPIFDCDQFEMVSNGFDTVVKHIPNVDEQQDYEPAWIDGHLRGVLVSTKENNEISHRFVSFGKILQIAGVSPSKKNGSYSPYTLWNLEMYIGKAIKYVLSKMPMEERQEQIARAVEIENESDKYRIDELDGQEGSKKEEDNIITVVDEETFEQCKQTIINGETTLQELCDSSVYEFSKEQYDELEKLENAQ